jgi:hypothetical protein
VSSVSRGIIDYRIPSGWLLLIRIWTPYLDRLSRETRFLAPIPHLQWPSRESGFLKRALIPAGPFGKVQLLRRGSHHLFLRQSAIPFPAPVCQSLLKTIADGGSARATSVRADETVPRRACSNRGFRDGTWTRTFHLRRRSYWMVGLHSRSRTALRKAEEGKENREGLKPVAPLESGQTRAEGVSSISGASIESWFPAS